MTDSKYDAVLTSAGAPPHAKRNSGTNTQTVSETNKHQSCNMKMSSLYIFAILVGIAGIIILIASPKECPPDYEEEDCLTCVDCHKYECRKYQNYNIYCAEKRITGGTIAGGVIMLITSMVFLIMSCCFQGKCFDSILFYIRTR